VRQPNHLCTGIIRSFAMHEETGTAQKLQFGFYLEHRSLINLTLPPLKLRGGEEGLVFMFVRNRSCP
jgi:hypothetical protein